MSDLERPRRHGWPLSASYAPMAAPFRLVAGAIVVEATINDRPVAAMLDTGLPLSLVRPELAADLGLGRLRAAAFRSEQRSVTTDIAGPVRLAIGGSVLELPTVMSAPATFLAQAGVGVEVIIGQDVLGAAIFDIDFERGWIRAVDRSSGPERLPDFVRTPIETDSAQRVVVRVDLPTARQVPAILDLGSNPSVMMSATFAERHGLLRGAVTSTGLIATLGGISETTAFSLTSLGFGGVRICDVPADALQPWSSPQPINLGIGLLRRFNLILDLPGGAVWTRAIPGQEFDREMSGVLAAHRGSDLEIVHVARNSPAQAAGLRPGDHILALNGRAVGDDYFTSAMWRWRYGPPGGRVTMKLQDRMLQLTLRRYY